jgi:Flp pilus assembly pilin Flp
VTAPNGGPVSHGAGPPAHELMTRPLQRLVLDEGAEDLVEYALLAAFVGVAAAVAVAGFDNVINVVYASWDAATQALWEPTDPR